MREVFGTLQAESTARAAAKDTQNHSHALPRSTDQGLT